MRQQLEHFWYYGRRALRYSYGEGASVVLYTAPYGASNTVIDPYPSTWQPMAS